MKFLITGGSGFVGQQLCNELLRQNYDVRVANRTQKNIKTNVEEAVVGDINGSTNWIEALKDIDVVIHLAARVHVMCESSENPLREFLAVNFEGTINLAQASVIAGVKRLVFLSSVKVNGEQTVLPYTEIDSANPQDPYSISKWEAEQALNQLASSNELEVVIIRSPLVYGAGVRGNFLQMINVLLKGIPLPLASVNNSRSLIYIENLVDALILCATHLNGAGQTYLVSDGEDISTPDLLVHLGNAMSQPVRLFFCPPALLKLVGQLVGKSDQIDRLLGSLQVDSSKIRREMGWHPPVSLVDGLKRTIHGSF